ncbi:MAG TPA: hypothetical protein VMF06_03220 [Candidatus Limnocylindria bacterium]|jgi:hypothetical protein|nr:hypothetical protein [Candidatus Limnocylindria bacterium]
MKNICVWLATVLCVIGCGGRSKTPELIAAVRQRECMRMFCWIDTLHAGLFPEEHVASVGSGRFLVTLAAVLTESLECDSSGGMMEFGQWMNTWTDLYCEVTRIKEISGQNQEAYLECEVRLWPATIDTYRDNIGRKYEMQIPLKHGEKLTL